jgi:hypothetical protein
MSAPDQGLGEQQLAQQNARLRQALTKFREMAAAEVSELRKGSVGPPCGVACGVLCRAVSC